MIDTSGEDLDMEVSRISREMRPGAGPRKFQPVGASGFRNFDEKLVSPSGEAAYIETIMTHACLHLLHRITDPAA